jgi:hypothetical protein
LTLAAFFDKHPPVKVAKTMKFLGSDWARRGSTTKQSEGGFLGIDFTASVKTPAVIFSQDYGA